MAVTEAGKAPDFDLPVDGGGSIRLSDLKGRTVILYFYPNDDTPGCTTEAIDFTSALPAFEAAGATVIGISPNTIESHEKFKAKHKLGVVLASDPDHKVLEAYGAWGEKMMYGRKIVGVIRSTVIVGPDGRIARIWPKVRVKGHVEAVLEAVRQL